MTTSLCSRFARPRILFIAAAVLVALPVNGEPTAHSGLSPSTGVSIDLLALGAAGSDGELPPPWRTRAVRGQRAPDTQILDSAGTLFLRIEGTYRAGWFVRSVDPRLLAAGGQLSWSWRAPVAPAGTDLRSTATDDAALRVFVSFGPPRFIGRAPRAIFYSFGGPEPTGYARLGHDSGKVFVVRVGDAATAREWRSERVDPYADYVRAWGGAPPPIAVVGLLQDTDQTRGRAVADLRSLRWSPADVIDP